MTIIEIIINEKTQAYATTYKNQLNSQAKNLDMQSGSCRMLPSSTLAPTILPAAERMKVSIISVSLPIYRKHLILDSYRYVFLQAVDITGYTVSVEIVFSRLDDAGVPNLTIGAENKTCPSI